MNRFVLTAIAGAVMAIGTSGALAQSTGSGPSATPSPGRSTDAMPADTTGKTKNKKSTDSNQPLTTPTDPKNTPPYGHIEGGQPATGGTSSVNKPTGATKGPDSGAARAIEGETRRGAEANKPTPADKAGVSRSGGGSPPPDSPVSKTNPSGGSK